MCSSGKMFHQKMLFHLNNIWEMSILTQFCFAKKWYYNLNIQFGLFKKEQLWFLFWNIFFYYYNMSKFQKIFWIEPSICPLLENCHLHIDDYDYCQWQWVYWWQYDSDFSWYLLFRKCQILLFHQSGTEHILISWNFPETWYSHSCVALIFRITHFELNFQKLPLCFSFWEINKQ